MADVIASQAVPCEVFINGEWRASRAKEFSEIKNPATGEVLARLPHSTREEVDAAVKAAAAAFPAWAATPPVERARVMFRYRQLLEDNLEEVTRLITLENGKPLAEARGSLRRGIEVVEFVCGIATLMMGKSLENVALGIDMETIRQPLGVCVGIPPFNFPAMVPMWMFPIAIACGNAFVLKPSDRAPLTATRITRLLAEAGLPAGVMNVVHGTKATVEALIAHPLVKAISFVGSSPVARAVYTQAATHGKRVQAMGGAKNHMVLMADAQPEQAIRAILGSAFGSAGQRCMAGSVLVTVGEASERLLPRLIEAARNLQVGPGQEPGTDVGPVISEEARRRILSYIERGLAEGATLALDGRQGKLPSQGTFLGPTIFDHVQPEMTIVKEEIFGPVLSVIRVKDVNEALEVVNRSTFGNASVIFTQNGGVARQYSSRVQAGMVGINVGVPVPMAFFPFSGWKGSFYGDLHAQGMDAVEFYTEQKVITSRW